MRNRTVGALTVAALALGAAGGATAATAYDDDARPHLGAMMAGPLGGQAGGSMGGLMGHHDGPGREEHPGHRMGVASEEGYLVEMIAHHEEAIAAAKRLSGSDRAAMRRFGEQIVASQSAQVEQMERWLAQWYPDASPDDDYEPMMRDLDGLSGDELDRAFLEDMVGHHMGAVMMSRQLLLSDLADHDEVATLAEAVIEEQHREIFTMQEWLSDWYDVSWHGAGMHHRGSGNR